MEGIYIFEQYLLGQLMNKEIILRIYAPEGRKRLSMMSGDTFGELILKLSKQMNYAIRDLVIMTEDSKLMALPEGKKLRQIPYFVDGAILRVDCKNKPKEVKQDSKMQVKQEVGVRCNHPPGGKCLNCMGKEKEEKQKCTHGPGGKCLNCTQVDLKERTEQLCQHGPNAKCIHCLDKQFISNTAHMSFDQFIEDRKLKCKGVHPSEVKCNNCLPPSKIQYEVDRNCKNHETYPKAMCNKCIPPSVLIKRQEYRHVDYVQFMNIAQIQSFIKYWLSTRTGTEKRIGYLYGYYADDPHYKGGIRVIVEALYEPAQRTVYDKGIPRTEITEKESEVNTVEMLANGLTLERVGWIYTETNHDCVMDCVEVRRAADLQEQFRVTHESGYSISNFVTVIVRTDEKNPNEVKPEVYMISDQGQAIERSDLFEESPNRRTMKVKDKKNNDALPNFVVGGKNVIQFEPQFLLVKIAHGAAKDNRFAILKKSEFPPYSRSKPTKKDLKEYLLRQKHQKQAAMKYGDFNLLLYLSHEIDLQTVLTISDAVAHEGKVTEFLDQLIEHKADL